MVAKLPTTNWGGRLVQRWSVVLLVLIGAWHLGPMASPRILMMVGAPVAFALVMVRPDLGVLGLVVAAALVPTDISTGTETTVNIAIIGVGVLTIAWLLRMVLVRSVVLSPSVVNRPWLTLSIVAGVSVVAGAAAWNAWVVTKSTYIIVQMAQWAMFIFAACAFWLLGNYAPDRRLLRRTVALVILFALIELVGQTIRPLDRVSVYVLMDGPIFRVWAIALTIGLALQWKGLSPAVRLSLVGFSFAFVLVPYFAMRDWASGWMPGLIALAAVILIWLWNERRQVALVIVTMGTVVGSILMTLAFAGIDRWSLDTRIIAWSGLFELLEGRWLFGLGLASYWHYWRGVFGTMSYLDPETGYLHFTMDPAVNMHNNYMDVLGQMGIIGVIVLLWLIVALYVQAARTYRAETDGFGRAYAIAAFGGLTGMLFAGMLGDWFFPFVYNIGLAGFRDAFIGWLLLGGLVLLDATRTSPEAPTPTPPT